MKYFNNLRLRRIKFDLIIAAILTTLPLFFMMLLQSVEFQSLVSLFTIIFLIIFVIQEIAIMFGYKVKTTSKTGHAISVFTQIIVMTIELVLSVFLGFYLLFILALRCLGDVNNCSSSDKGYIFVILIPIVVLISIYFLQDYYIFKNFTKKFKR